MSGCQRAARTLLAPAIGTPKRSRPEARASTAITTPLPAVTSNSPFSLQKRETKVAGLFEWAYEYFSEGY